MHPAGSGNNIARVALSVLTLDWLFVGWKTFIWLDLAALISIGWPAARGCDPHCGRSAAMSAAKLRWISPAILDS